MTYYTFFNADDYQSLILRIRNLTPGAQRQWGKMNVTEMLYHLTIATGCGIGLYQLADESTLLNRTIVKILATVILPRFPQNVQAPKGFLQPPGRALEFVDEKRLLLDVLKTAHPTDQHFYPHPMFGRMSKKLWGRLVYRHIDHHLRQFSA
jgi:hypothetical protein